MYKFGYIISFALIAIGVFLYIFSLGYSGTSWYLLFSVALLLIVSGVLLLRSLLKKGRKDYDEDLSLLKEAFILTAEPIRVDFSQCQIKSNSYIEETEAEHSRDVAVANSLAGRSENNVVQTNVYQHVLIFKHEYNGEEEMFESPVINLEKATLLLKLSLQGHVMLYVNKEDRTQYFFDLDFLEEQEN